jgi:YhcH/YjgK/YiaL family protein
LAEADRYAPLHPLFADALRWLRQTETGVVADGRYQLRGEKLFVIVESGQTHNARDRRFESHRRYIDIQVNLVGPEVIEWTPVAGLTVVDDFQPDNDIAFYAEPATPATPLMLPPNHLAIFWPQDAHKPICNPGAASVPFRKMVFKVEC